MSRAGGEGQRPSAIAARSTASTRTDTGKTRRDQRGETNTSFPVPPLPLFPFGSTAHRPERPTGQRTIDFFLAS